MKDPEYYHRIQHVAHRVKQIAEICLALVCIIKLNRHYREHHEVDILYILGIILGMVAVFEIWAHYKAGKAKKAALPGVDNTSIIDTDTENMR